MKKQERVKLIMTVQVQENAAKISSVSRVSAHQVMTKLAEATVVATEEIVNLLLNAKADSVACT